MIYLKLFFQFIIVGAFSFGGAYSAIPLVKDVAEQYEIITSDAIADFIAISESTPGSIGVNLSTFIGITVGDLPGAFIATFAEVLPAFVIMIIVSMFLKDALKNSKIKFLLSVIRPSIIGIIMSVGIYMLLENIGIFDIGASGIMNKNLLKSLIILLFLACSMIFYKIFKKKSISTINVIILGAIFGIAINYYM